MSNKFGTCVINNLGLCNGTRMVIENLLPNSVICRVGTGFNAGDMVIIPKIDVTSIDDGSLPFILRRRQFPLAVAFAMTINKSQGQIFQRVGLFLNEPIFDHGQTYVAFSRVPTSTALKVQSPNRHLVDNVVFREIL